MEPVHFPHLLIALASEVHARLLANYLQSQRIQIEMRLGEPPHQYQIFIVNSEQWPQAHEITQEFVSNPNAQKFQEASWIAEQPLSKPMSFGMNMGNWVSGIKMFPVTVAMLGICILTFTALFFNGIEVLMALQFQPFEQLKASGEWWRLWSPAIIHFSVLHIVFNLLWWWILGRVLEVRFGHFFLILFFLITALSSNYAQFLQTGANFGGLSGVVYALFGFVWWVGWLKPHWGIMLPKPLVGFMLIWMVLGYADVLWANMANTAHSVGLLTGCFIALMLCKGNLGIKLKE